MFYSLYFGFKKAIWKGLAPMVRQFYKALKRFIKSRSGQINIPIDLNTIKVESLTFQAHVQPEKTHKKLSDLFKTVNKDSLKEPMNNLIKNMSNSGNFYDTSK